MKSRIFIFVIIAIFTLQVSAQITITSSDLPKPNDTARYSIADPISITNIDSSGANYTWDYSNLKAQKQQLNEYVPSSKTAYMLYFFGATKFGLLVTEALNLGVIQLTNVYDFYDNTSSVYKRIGMGITFSGFPLASDFSDKDEDEVYQFPLDYGDRDSTTFHFNFNLATLVTYSTSGYRINEVDGWGKITTPYGVFDCIRIKTTINSNDTITYNGMPFGIPNNSVEYKWLAKGEKFPILKVIGTETMIGFVANEVNYRDIYHYVYDPTAVVADFKASKLKPHTKDTVSLLNQSKNALPLSTYTWSITPKTIEFVHETDKNTENPDVVFKQKGTYTVKLEVISFNSKHDTTKVDYITVNDAASIFDKPNSDNRIIVYPNPAFNQYFYIQFNEVLSADYKLTLYDLFGKEVNAKYEVGSANQIKCTFNELSHSLYFIKIYNQNQTTIRTVMLNQQ
ncbi:MAG: T9SS type A sorting domain-containing protein [Bacteroidetes bacterium]|nr:T9SS type A sorting domain-containing protein [Bacteroidota bacterium]